LVQYDGLPAINANAVGRGKCLASLKPDSGDMTRLITSAYDRDPSKWTVSPYDILVMETNRVCKSFIDAERAKFGFKPLLNGEPYRERRPKGRFENPQIFRRA
jgi:hypothetical protein